MIPENISDDELKEELARRKKAKEKREKPKPLKSPNFDSLRETCQEYIDELAESGYVGDYEHFIFERAIAAIYGKDVWKWINARLKG